MENQDRLKLLLRLFPYIKNKNRILQLKIDSDSINYISLREIASKISEIIKFHFAQFNLNYKNIYITDATAGVGGNTISFGMNFGHVTSIEIDELRYNYLINNINVYNLKNIISFNANSISLLKYIEEQDVVFIDPPWGGKEYKNHKKLILKLSSEPIEQLCNDLMDKNITLCPPKLILLKLPCNYDIKYLYNQVKSNFIYLHKLKKMNIISIINYHSSTSDTSL